MLSKVIRFPFASWKWPARHTIAVKRYNETEIKTHFFISNYNSCSYPLPSPCPLMLAHQRGLITPPCPGARLLQYLQPKPPKTLKFSTAGV